MPRTLTETVYQFDELSDCAKENARAWYRESEARSGDHYWAEAVIEDADRMAEIMGITIHRRRVPLHGGGERQDPAIYWQLGYMQSDGVWIEADYRYVPGAHRKIREEAPKDQDLHTIADRLLALQKDHGYQLTAVVKDNDRGPMDLELDVDSDAITREVRSGTYDEFRSIVRAFEQWVYNNLRREDEYRSSDEQVDETIRANEYEFTVDGNRSVVI
jgi:hypothetical protein